MSHHPAPDHPASNDTPAIPAGLVDMPLRDLADAWSAHTSRLVAARHGIGRPLTPARLKRHGLDSLALGAAIIEQIATARWVTVVEALDNGATSEHIAAALGLEELDLAIGLCWWADEQLRKGLMSADRRGAVHALTAEWFE